MNNNALKIIDNAIKNNKLSHAYLFYGEIGVNIDEYILDVIKLIFKKKVNLNLNVSNVFEIKYPDLRIIKPNEEGLIKKESVNQNINDLYESSLSKNKLKILFIKDIDLGNKSSLNSLLKFIEEPVDDLIILLSTNHLDNVIPTIKSRTQNIFIKQKSIIEKIEIFQSYVPKDKLVLISNIYSNIEEVKTINYNLFNSLYENILSTLEKTLVNVNYLKINFLKFWTKENTKNTLSILQLFFYQVQVKISKNLPLFPNHEWLINKYKMKSFNYFKIQKMIEETKNNFKKNGSFTLQRANFLIKLENELN